MDLFFIFSLEEGLHFFAFHLERQKNHVYHVNPVKCFRFPTETLELFQFSPVELLD